MWQELGTGRLEEMEDLFDTLVGYLDQDGWKYNKMEAHSAIEMGVAGERGNYRLVVLVDNPRSIVRFLTFVEGKVAEARRREVMEFVTRANYGLLLGNFELDLGDGEVRFKCSVDVEESTVTYRQYQNLLFVSLATMDRYYPGLQKVLQGRADAAAAVADSELWEPDDGS